MLVPDIYAGRLCCLSISYATTKVSTELPHFTLKTVHRPLDWTN